MVLIAPCMHGLNTLAIAIAAQPACMWLVGSDTHHTFRQGTLDDIDVTSDLLSISLNHDQL